ncbi:MAG TPA: aldo/keto reductase, partial [Myxococcaceae bacterium]|nr:aldo/keto reductase [Myxococcaceae bacterium]
PPAGSRFATNPMYPKRYWTDALIELTSQYRALAAAEGMDGVTLAYAWVAGRKGVDSILVGPGSVAHLDAALQACAVELSPKVRSRVDAIHHAFLGTDATYAR